MSTLLFDLDGTLLDVRPRHYSVYSDAHRELGMEPLGSAAYWSRRRDGAGTFEIASDLPEFLFSRFTEMWMERVESRKYLPYGSVFEGAHEVLSELAKDHRLLLITLRRKRDLLMEELRARDLDEAFEKVLSPIGEAPPDKAALLIDTYVNGDTIVIGDSEADVALARDLDARVIGLSTGVRSSEFLMRAGAETVLDSLAKLPAAV